jgi:hypothetical protein
VVEGSHDFEAARLRYVQGDFDAAQPLFEACASKGDRAAAVMLERCKTYAKAPPPAGWDTFRPEK